MESSKKIIIIALSIIIAGFVIGGAILYIGNANKDQATANLADQIPGPPKEDQITSPSISIPAEGHPFIGREDAPVTIVEVNDYQCPFCKKFALNTFPELKKKYIDTGKVKFVFRDFPLPYHPYSQKAAEAALCYSAQGLDYVDFYQELFDNNDKLETDDLISYAVKLKADKEKFSQCLNSGNFADEVKESFENINQLVQSARLDNFGTPAFFVNGKPLIGAQPLSAFDEIIEKEIGEETKE